MSMYQQVAMIERVRELCLADERLEAAMMYGSWARGEGDEHSDIEFVLFFRDEALPEVDQREWVSRIAPVELYFVNEFGNGAAIFENLVRGEFHFDRALDIPQVESWRETDTFPTLDATLLLDRSARLARHLAALVGPDPRRDTPERVRFLCDSFLNWMLFGHTVLMRGELARSLEILAGPVGRYLLWLARLSEGRTEHWPTPSRALETDLSPEAYMRYAACTATLDPGALRLAYTEAWEWGLELTPPLAARHGVELPTALIEKLDRRIRGLKAEDRSLAPE